MLTFFCILAGIAAIVIGRKLPRGCIRLAQAIRAGEKPRAKALAWAILRIGLYAASCACVALSQGRNLRDIKVALVLTIIAGITRFPSDLRTLRGPPSGPPKLGVRGRS